ncbi:FAD:protein FMN transferase [Candidatus Zixiibacteriota bacterium]
MHDRSSACTGSQRIGGGDPINPRTLTSSITLLLLLCSCGSESPLEVSRTRLLLGTAVTITVYGANESRALDAIEAAFAEVARVDRLMSTYRSESQVGVLNRTGRVKAGPDLLHVLERARAISEASSGAFDITVKPLLDLFSRRFEQEGRAPDPDEIASCLQLVGYQRLTVDGELVSLPSGSAISLGGIAKGYAIDLAVEALLEEGIDHALVNAGGDLRALGNREGEPWRIAVQNPRDREDLLATIPLSGLAVATSGDYERFFDSDRTYHHIIDPRSGLSAGSVMSVTITARSALDADALATAVFVMGIDGGLALIESLDGVEAFLVSAEGAIVTSEGMNFIMLHEF